MVKRFPVNQPLDYADHPEVEIGLVKLFELTGNRAYFDLANHIAREIVFARPPDLGDGANRQPLADQRVAWGHAVRTAYVFNGATDVVRVTGAADLRTALDSLWHSIVDSRPYVHGGAGGPAEAEQLQPPWLLDSAQTYSESCANIAQGQWAHSLNLLTGEARYADLGRWVAAESAGTVVLNQFVGGRISFHLAAGDGVLAIASGLPWNGNVAVTVERPVPGAFTIALRLPGWAREQPVPGDIYRYLDPAVEVWSLAIDGQPVLVQPDASGYLRLSREWRAGTRIELRLPMTPRRVAADARAALLAGRVAIMRGPVLYCLEQIDNPSGPVTRAELPRSAKLSSAWQPNLLGGVTTVTAEITGRGSAPRVLTFVPYFAWENRGVDGMNVGLVDDPARSVPLNLPAVVQAKNTKG